MTVSELDRVRVLRNEINTLNAEIDYQLDVLWADQCGEIVSNLVSARGAAWAELDDLLMLNGIEPVMHTDDLNAILEGI